MIEIDFGPMGGGVRSFRTLNALKTHFEAEVTAWEAFPGLPERRATNSMPRAISILASHWRKLANSLEQTAPALEGESWISGHVAQHLSAMPLISAASLEGRSLVELGEEKGLNAAAYGAQFLQMQQGAAFDAQLTRLQLESIWALQAKLNGFGGSRMTTSKAAITKLQSDLQRTVAEHTSHLEQAEIAHRAQLARLERVRKWLLARADRAKECLKSEIATQRDTWENDWNGIYAAFTERLKIESAVKLWTDRAVEHENGASNGRKVAVAAGLLGLCIAGAVAVGGYRLAGWLFAEAMVDRAGATATGLRATFGSELIFTGAMTLLYLTMYLWTMRILVRLYMTEHHLAIDARARSSMAHTYLALIKDGAASDGDRAIVLASLFRPVVDGIVKDDGLPMVTPAALLSGFMASGKN